MQLRKKLTTIGLLAVTLLAISCSDDDYSYNSGSSASNRRCAAITQNGTRCKRQAAPGSIYCWQHKR